MKSHTQPAAHPVNIVPFGAAIFAGAFLLFQVQPIIAKFILPWFGGTPAVWTACMLFFQIFLLIGYLYAHLLSKYVAYRAQAVVHFLILLISLFLLPIIPDESWKPDAADSPVSRIISMLTFSIGLPYAVLSSTSPLMQRWFSVVNSQTSPYRLYALSNAGSFLALVSYPVIVEPFLSRNTQAMIWSWAMAGFALLCGICAWTVWQQYRNHTGDNIQASDSSKNISIPQQTRLLWIAFSTVASIVLLAITNKLCQDVAVVPFLWILPLTLYLLSFVICFDKPAWYSRRSFGLLFIIGCGVISMIPYWEGDPPLMLSLIAYPALLFIVCMICHGELYKLKPSTQGLTSYYLTIAFGGALGGFAVVIVAPVLFNDYAELLIGILLCAILLLVIFYRDKKSGLAAGTPRWAWVVLIGLVVAFTFVQQHTRTREQQFTISSVRNFYGTLKVAEYGQDQPKFLHRTMRHGAILHGLQYLAPRLQALPTAYYTEKSGVGYCLRYFPNTQQRKIGIVGLGVGTLVTWGRTGDSIRVYEINPDVETLADSFFTYISNCPAVVDVSLGDGRLLLEREAPQKFDILILDAFNSDSPPVHLLTTEAFEIYRRHLKPDGVIALNITCKYLNFFPIVARLAEHTGYRWAYIHDPNTEDEFYRSSSIWMLVTNNTALLEQKEVLRVSTLPRIPYNSFPLWTDDYTSLFPILTW